MINTMNIIVIILSRKKLFFCPASTGKHAVMVCLTIYLCCYGVFLQFIYEVDESDDKYYEHLIINTMNTIVIILSWKSFSSVQPALVNMLLWPLRKNLILSLITQSRTVMMMSSLTMVTKINFSSKVYSDKQSAALPNLTLCLIISFYWVRDSDDMSSLTMEIKTIIFKKDPRSI